MGAIEKGKCAFIDVRESGHGEHTNSAGAETGVDALLPLDLDPDSRLIAQDNLYRRLSLPPWTPRSRPKVYNHELGGEIVNSITITLLRSGKQGLQDETVALVANNDKTVRIFSLTQSRVIGTLYFPTQMNHATISPDGELLIAAGDEPRAFICRRKRLDSIAMDGNMMYARYEWAEIAEPKLSVAIPHDMCFSTAFSPSGHICAVASQAGTVTFFDTSQIGEDLDADEAVINALKSSRPAIEPDSRGAVRSMSFSPEPWSLFAWAEDQGRVCITDLRNGFGSRQTIELDDDIASAERVHISDYQPLSTSEQRDLEIEARFVQRHREALVAQDHLAAVNHAADYMELAAERRRAAREAQTTERPADSTASPYALTDAERRVLDSLRMSRQQQNEREGDDRDSNQHPFSVRYSRPPSANPSAQPTDSSRDTHTLTQVSRSTSIHQYMRDRALERHTDGSPRVRPSDRSFQPRRRSSVVIANSNHTNPSSSSHPSSLAPIGNVSNLSTSPSRLSSSNSQSSATDNQPNTNTTISTATRPWQTSDTSVNSSTLNHTSPGSNADPWQTIADAMVSTDTPTNRLQRELRRERDVLVARSLEYRMQQARQTERMERLRLERLRSSQERDRIISEGIYDDYELEMLRRLGDRGRAFRGGRNLEGVSVMGLGWSPDGRYL